MLDQEQFVSQILEEFGMVDCNPVSTPLDPKILISEEMCPHTAEQKAIAAKRKYPQLIGKLLYLATCTWLDISYAVQELSRFMSNWGERHWNAAKHVVRYLKGTKHYGIIYGNLDKPYPLFRTFADSDWASGEQRRSVAGYIIKMGGGPISWSSKKQTVVTLSSSEAEYIALTFAARQVLWLRSFAQELGFEQYKASLVYCDNRGAIHCSQDPKAHSRMKHIEIRFHFIRYCVNKNLIDVEHIPGTENVADITTKSLTRTVHDKWVIALRLPLDPGGVSLLDE
jgi:hypothetical protein